MKDNEVTQAPWNGQQLANIIKWQNAGYVHELTCPNRHKLDVNERGLICHKCNYTQTWVPNCCADGELLQTTEKMLKIAFETK